MNSQYTCYYRIVFNILKNTHLKKLYLCFYKIVIESNMEKYKSQQNRKVTDDSGSRQNLTPQIKMLWVMLPLLSSKIYSKTFEAAVLLTVCLHVCSLY